MTQNTMLLISGPVGVGKTTAGDELTYILEDNDIPHTFVDLDNLAHTFPRPADDPFGQRLALKNLEVVWNNAKALGSKNLILARVLEQESSLASYLPIIPLENITVCTLMANADTLTKRVTNRERGSGLEWHLNRSQELRTWFEENPVPGFIVETSGKTPTQVAHEIFSSMTWAR